MFSVTGKTNHPNLISHSHEVFVICFLDPNTIILYVQSVQEVPWVAQIEQAVDIKQTLQQLSFT
jgi:hypothetical protein